MGLFDKFKKVEKIETQRTHNLGGCIITRSLYEGTSKLKWIFREKSANSADNGWRALGDSDTEEYINVPENNLVVDFDRLEEKYGDDFNWGTDLNCDFFQNQLTREADLTPYQEVKALAKCYSNDDVLFLLNNKVYRIYHLTYSNGEARYIEFQNRKDVIEYIEKQYVDEYL